MTKTNKDKYGGLLDKYMDDKHVDYRIKMECEKEAKNKYGSLRSRMILFLMIYLMSVMRAEIYSRKKQTNMNRQILGDRSVLSVNSVKNRNAGTDKMLL